VREKKSHELVGAVIGNIIGLAVLNTVILWRPFTHGVILDTWVSILWAANLSLIVQVAGHAMLAFYRPARFYAFVEMVFAGLGLLSVIVFFLVFPIDFSAISLPALNTVTRIALWCGMAGSAIATIVWLVRMLAGHDYAEAAAR
jgi:hypothetical protein